jgi:hypothetical protein
MPIIEAGEKELPVALACLERAQAILGEAILPGRRTAFYQRMSSIR